MKSVLRVGADLSSMFLYDISAYIKSQSVSIASAASGLISTVKLVKDCSHLFFFHAIAVVPKVHDNPSVLFCNMNGNPQIIGTVRIFAGIFRQIVKYPDHLLWVKAAVYRSL